MNGVHPKGRTNLGSVLRMHRSVRDIDTRTLAKRIGISAATLSRIERGHDMDAATLLKVWIWLVHREPPHPQEKA